MVSNRKNFKYITITEQLTSILADYYKSLSVKLENITYSKSYTLIEIRQTQPIKTSRYLEKPQQHYVATYYNVVLLEEYVGGFLHKISSLNTFDNIIYSFKVDGDFKVDLASEDYNITWFILNDN